MIQRLPYQRDLPGRPNEDEYDENWRTAITLMSSSTAAELLSDGLTPDRLLFRLFHSEGVRAYQPQPVRSEEHTSELQSLMRISYAVFCLKKKNKSHKHKHTQ